MGKDRHHQLIKPDTVTQLGMSSYAFFDKADLLVHAPGPVVVGIHVQLDSVESDLFESVAHDETSGLCAQTSSPAGRSDQGSKAQLRLVGFQS